MSKRILKAGCMAIAAMAMLALPGCASREPERAQGEPAAGGDRAQHLFDTRQFHEATQILAALTRSTGQQEVNEKLLAGCVRDTDYAAALAILGQQASAGPDRATRGRAALAMATICAKRLGFNLRAGQLLRRVEEMAKQDPALMSALAQEYEFSPAHESALRREQATYGTWWDRFCRVRELYCTGQHHDALREIEVLRMEVVADPLLSLWAGKVKLEVGDPEGARRDLEDARSRFTTALRMLDVPEQWQQPVVYGDELNECVLAIGRGLYMVGRYSEAQTELGRVPQWSPSFASAQALARRAEDAQSKRRLSKGPALREPRPSEGIAIRPR